MALADALEEALPQLLRTVHKLTQQQIKERVVALRNATAPASIDSRRVLELARLAGLIRSVYLDDCPCSIKSRHTSSVYGWTRSPRRRLHALRNATNTA